MVEDIINQYMEIEEKITENSYLVTSRVDRAFPLLKKHLTEYNLLPMLKKRDDPKAKKSFKLSDYRRWSKLISQSQRTTLWK